jgi:hypothetical protein
VPQNKLLRPVIMLSPPWGVTSQVDYDKALDAHEQLVSCQKNNHFAVRFATTTKKCNDSDKTTCFTDIF